MAISTFNGLNIALRGLLAQQRSLDVTSHNIANAETEGYSRQVASLGTAPTLNIAAGAVLNGAGARLGQGVDVVAYQRIRDDFLDLQWRAQNMAAGEQAATADRLGQVEDVLQQTRDTGLGVTMDKFYSAWQDLASYPESGPAKTAVIGTATNLAKAINNLDHDMAQVAADATAEATQLLSPQGPVAQMATELAKLNESISRAVQAGVTPNDALDRRDLLLDKLSQYGQVSVTQDTTAGNEGMITVHFGGAATALVDATTATVPPLASLTSPGGRIGALQTIATSTIPGYRAALDAIASSLATAVNTAHPTPVFSGTTAATLSVVATASSINAGTGAPGDTSVARAIAAQRTGAASNAYTSLLTQIGGDVSAARQGEATSAAVVDSLTARRQSVAGVSMDEEMTNMVRFQRGYQAAARALTTMDEALDTLINRTGRVGL